MKILIPKKSGTYADALCAIGYASLLAELRKTSARIEDLEYAYEVSSPHGIAADEWHAPSPGYRYIWRRSKEPRPLGLDSIVMDYENEQSLAQTAKKAISSSRARKQVTEALQEVSDTPLAEGSPDFRFAAIIESMRKGWSSDQSLYRWIMDNQSACLTAVRERMEGKEASIGSEWSNSQLLNPSTGKGIHAAKTVAKSASGFNLTETFDEWMKLRGIWNAMLGFRSGDDFKIFVISPGSIRVDHLEHLRIELRNCGMWGIVRLDIEAILRLLQLVMLHSEYKESNGIPIKSKTPAQIIRGLQLAFFKSLGTAAALMNDSLFPLPSWFVIDDGTDVDTYLEICQEPFGAERGKHGPLSALKDDRSDDVELLQKYRRWLTSGNLFDLLEFHASFASHLLRKSAASEFAPPFRMSVLHRLLTKGYPHVNEIIVSSGFQNIARAIRNTTIYAVGLKNSRREIRFGLAQKFKQRIKAGNFEFLAELGDFVQQQNWEVLHRLGGQGYVVTDADLDDIVRLTEKFGAELVGMLLLAYGFARADSVAGKGDASEVSSQSA